LAPVSAHMAAIYLTHPVHGAKVATMELEAELDGQNRWSLYHHEPAVEEVFETPNEVYDFIVDFDGGRFPELTLYPRK